MTVEATSAAVSAIESTYRQRTARSAELYRRGRRAVPGGNSRQASYWEPYPIFVERAAGTRLFDVDGNEYVDLNYNYTAMVHGHAYSPILEAVDLARGTGWAANNVAMVELAEQLVARVASVEQVRFTNSGTEAALLALLVAREITGRHKVLMARFGYHGSLEEHESGTFDRPGPNTLLGEYNDLGSFSRVLAEHGPEIAAVFIEPVMGAGGIIPGTAEFLHGLRDAAHQAGTLFVLDEVITFRLGVGGRQEALGLDPDLTMFGKLIGGGFPVGALGGKEKLLRIFDPKGEMKAFHSGTYNANPVTAAAGCVSVRELTAERIDQMHLRAEQLEAAMRSAADSAGVPLSVHRVGSLCALYLSEELPPTSMQRSDGEAMGRFHLAALNHGLLLAPRGMMVACTVMDDALIEEVGARAKAAFADVAAELETSIR